MFVWDNTGCVCVVVLNFVNRLFRISFCKRKKQVVRRGYDASCFGWDCQDTIRTRWETTDSWRNLGFRRKKNFQIDFEDESILECMSDGDSGTELSEWGDLLNVHVGSDFELDSDEDFYDCKEAHSNKKMGSFQASVNFGMIGKLDRGDSHFLSVAESTDGEQYEVESITIPNCRVTRAVFIHSNAYLHYVSPEMIQEQMDDKRADQPRECRL